MSLSIGARTIRDNIVIKKRTVGTVIGHDKNRKPIICDDADGLCVTDHEHEFMALPTPKELLIVVRMRVSVSRKLLMKRVLASIAELSAAVRSHAAMMKDSITRARSDYAEGRALYFGTA